MKRKLFLMAALAALAHPALAADFDDYARVKSVSEQTERVNTPREECYSEYVPASSRPAERGVSGAVIGGVAGAILGNQVGGGRGRTAATAVGAVTGAIVGDRVQNDSGAQVASGEREVRRCRTVDHWETRNSGYRVTYEYAGRDYTTVLPYDPGNSMRVRVSVNPAGH